MKAYQLKIQIKNSHPPIWRRLIVPAGLSFSQLAVILNEAMGWCGYHLFCFEFYHLGIQVEDNVDEYDDFGWSDYEREEASETLIDTYLDTEEWFTYIYDFGDNWQHRVTVEKILEDYDGNYAQVLKYKGGTPYEDCGGIDEYYRLLETLRNPDSPEYEEMKEWTEGNFHTEYDMECVNESLKRLCLSEETGAPMTKNEIYEDLQKESKPLKRIEPNERGLYFGTGFTELDETELNHVTLTEILGKYTKQELMEIVKLHHMTGYSGLKKDAIVKYLSKDLLDKRVMCSYFRYLNDRETELLESENNFVQIDFMDDDYDTLLNGGYAVHKDEYFMEDYICIPEEVKEAYRINCDEEWKKTCKEEAELTSYMNLAAELYGVCPISKMLEIYEKYTGRTKGELEVLTFAEEIPENKKYFVIKEGRLVLKILTSQNYYREFFKMQGNISYYFPTKEEAELLMKKGYLPFDEALKSLQIFFRKNGEDTDEDAEFLCKRVQFMLRIGETPESIIEMLEEGFMGFDDVMENYKKQNQFIKKLMKVSEHTRMILLRGHTLAEINSSRQPERNGKIIRFPG